MIKIHFVILFFTFIVNIQSQKDESEDLYAEETLFFKIDYENLTKNWKSVRDCPLDIYKINLGVPIAGGSPAEEDEFAHMVAIGWTHSVTELVDWKCGGSLISENFILTAAHCSIWNGNEPDVVRLGDLDLQNNTKSDINNAQQFKIVEVIRHPEYSSSSAYHDLALLRIKGSVSFSRTVCPICIWTKPNVEFQSLEACGYGQTGIDENQSLTLLKVTLNPVETKACSKFFPPDRKLRNGLLSQHICAVDPEGRQDTCLGDSGGPLQIKFFAGEKTHPFLIGVTSFGKSCATKTPGVYVRVSEYKDWIQNITGISLDPIDCISKYEEHRKYAGGRNLYTGGYYEKDYVAHIVWSLEPSSSQWALGLDRQMSCGGSFIHYQYVLTSASCIAIHGVDPMYVKTALSKVEQTFKVANVIFHPKFIGDHLDNDIALIKLENEVKFSVNLHPICLWTEADLPYWKKNETALSFGLFDGHIHRFPFSMTSSTHNNNYYPIRLFYSEVDSSTFLTNSSGELTDYHFRYSNPGLVFPDSCQVDFGSPVVVREYPFKYGFFPYQMGINIQGRDCGYGSPFVALKVSKHIDWIDSVIFDKKFQCSSKLEEDKNQCKPPGAERGSCKKSSECMTVVNWVKSGQVALTDYICDFTDKRDPIVCCPEGKY